MIPATRTQAYLDYQASKPTTTLTATISPTPSRKFPEQPLPSDIQMVSPEIGWAKNGRDESVLRGEDCGATWYEVATTNQ